MPSVYIETTIPSFYFETRSDIETVAWRIAAKRWWDQHRRSYDLVISNFVLAELRRMPSQKAEKAMALLDDVTLLSETPAARDIAAYFIDHKLMPTDASGDASHLAMVPLHRVDFLLTWNCKHLANANKTAHLRVLNTRLGLPVPTLTTPFGLIPESQS